MEDASFAGALKRKECGTPLEAAEVWPLLDGFFRTEMARQTPIRGALTAMAAIARHADIVVLTNVRPDHQAARAAQQSALGPVAPVIGTRRDSSEERVVGNEMGRTCTTRWWAFNTKKKIMTSHTS